MIIHHVIYLFSLVERAFLQLQSSKPNAWFSFLGDRQAAQYKSISVSSDIRQQLLLSRFRWGSALPSGQFLPAKGGDHRRRFGSVVVVALWSGTNKNRSFYRRPSVVADHHQLLSGQVHWRRLKVKVKCTYWPLREP